MFDSNNLLFISDMFGALYAHPITHFIVFATVTDVYIISELLLFLVVN